LYGLFIAQAFFRNLSISLKIKNVLESNFQTTKTYHLTVTAKLKLLINAKSIVSQYIYSYICKLFIFNYLQMNIYLHFVVFIATNPTKFMISCELTSKQ